MHGQGWWVGVLLGGRKWGAIGEGGGGEGGCRVFALMTAAKVRA